MRLSVDLDDKDVQRGLDAMSRTGKNGLAPAFRAIRPHMRTDQREHASKHAGPESSWAKRAPSTIAKFKRSSSGRRLTRRPLGKLVAAVTYSASSSGVFATSRVPWSGVHQHGGVVGRGSKVPARPFLWISDRLLTIAKSVIERTIVAAFGGR